MARERTASQWFCLIGGAVLLVRGGVGVALDPEFAAPGEGWHQLIHLASGAGLLVASRPRAAATTVALAFGVIYAAIAVVGIVDGHDVAGVIPVEGGDNVLHTVLTAAALGAGVMALSSAFSRSGRPRTPAR